MKALGFMLCLAFLFSTLAPGQTNQPNTSVKAVAPRYEPATLLKMTATAQSHSRVLFQESMLDSPIISDKIVSYHYIVRVGTQRYTCLYTPAKQPGDMPDAWWKGNAPVQVRVEAHTMFIQQPKGIRVESQIVGQAADK